MTFNPPRFDRRSQKEFSQTLRKRVNNYFEENNIHRNGDSRIYVKTLVMFTLYFAPYVAMLAFDLHWAAYLACCAVTGIGLAGIGLAIMHDANHGSLSRKKWVNSIFAHSLNVIGGDALSWQLQHNVLHHSFTNVHGTDEDLEGGHILRFTPNEPWKPRHRMQHIYAWFLYSFMTFSWVTLKDFRRIFRYDRMGLLKSRGITLWGAFAKIAITKVLYLAYMIGVPIMIGYPVWLVLAGFMLLHSIGGVILAMIFQPAHIMDEHEFHAGDVGVIKESYESHQLKTTSNFAPSNKLLTWYCGGLNYQVEHHLFPSICHVHYPEIAKIVKATAAEFDLPYRSVPSFREALAIHQRTLKKLSDPAWAA